MSVMRFEEIGCFAQNIIIIHIIDDYVNEQCSLSTLYQGDRHPMHCKGIDDDDVAVDACGP